jgi:hypothetical protein
MENYRAAEAIVDAWLTHGVSWPLALGMLACAEAESSLDPTYNKGDAFGLYRWPFKRVQEIKKGCGVDILHSTALGEHVEAAMWELKNHRFLGMKEIDNCWTASGAARWATTMFEGAGIYDQHRCKRARQWALYFAFKRWSIRALFAAL